MILLSLKTLLQMIAIGLIIFSFSKNTRKKVNLVNLIKKRKKLLTSSHHLVKCLRKEESTSELPSISKI